MLKLLRPQVEQIFTQAREASPHECCGLIGGQLDNAAARSLYPLTNVAGNSLVTYEAAPEELFTAQRLMREREEQLLAIYHSHPRAAEPSPSDTDVRLAFYPSAIYLIVGLAGAEPVLRAFRISEKEHRWETVEYEIADG
jgi:proteasome lid subunit RPN8/RPN11